VAGPTRRATTERHPDGRRNVRESAWPSGLCRPMGCLPCAACRSASSNRRMRFA
jgi:hypothetical protein